MRILANYSYLIVYTILWMLYSCKRDDAPENPCSRVIVPTAFVFMDQPISTYDFEPTPENDSLTIERKLQFRSQYSDTNTYKHVWYIGADTVYDYSVSKDFSRQPTPKTYTVYHSVRWNPNKVCNPTDDGYDSSAFTFRITDRFYDLKVMGKYRVVIDSSPLDSSDIEFYFSKFGFADSVIKNPIAGPWGHYDGDVGLAAEIEFRVRGLRLFNNSVNRWFDTKVARLDGGHCMISNSYIKFAAYNRGTLSMSDGYFKVNPSSLICKGAFYNANRYYTISGRKIN